MPGELGLSDADGGGEVIADRLGIENGVAMLGVPGRFHAARCRFYRPVARRPLGVTGRQ